jgi:ribosomal protein L35AE/L33A
MHAVLTRVTIHDPEQATKRLQEDVVPRIREAPGLVAGYWVRLDGNQGRSMVMFESEEAAKAAVDRVRAMPESEFVTIDSVDVHEVVAHT